MTPARNGSLDILRAAAILMVLACHAVRLAPDGHPLRTVLGHGGRGVDLFFVLSGWLLGRQLFREQVRTGTIDLRKFWLRRWLRTLPAYYAVLFATFAELALKGNAGRIDWRYLVFLQNYLDPLPYFGISWSLCVEEHFYLVVAPAILFAGRSTAGVFVCGAAVFTLLALHALGVYSPKDEYGHTFVSQVRFEQCLAGVALAWAAVRRPAAWAMLCRFAVPLAAVGLVAFVVAAANRFVWWLPDWGVGGWAVLFATWVLLANSSPVWENIRFAPAAFVGGRAYSLYLVHENAIAAAKKFDVLAWPGRVAVAFALTFVLGEILYRVAERPFTRLREKLPATRTHFGKE